MSLPGNIDIPCVVSLTHPEQAEQKNDVPSIEIGPSHSLTMESVVGPVEPTTEVMLYLLSGFNY